MRREAAKIIAKETRDSYDQMAEEFSNTRAQFWGELSFLAEHATPGDRVLDIGCGNGRFYPLLLKQQIAYTGLDYSKGLLKEASRLHPNATFTEGDATALPFPDHSFDIAFSFATIHHIPSSALRQKFIEEAARILKPGGVFIFTAWDLWQPKYIGKYIWSLFMHWNPLASLDAGDIMLTFGKEKHRRYLHAFTPRELTRLCSRNGFTIIDTDIVERKSGSKQKNILVIARRK